jgi:hydroxymethylpyrimidine pyrophosphatase-like HAD family hydrolase
MRYQVLATDYDGTLAAHGQVDPAMGERLRQLKATGRRLVLVTGREMRHLALVYPDYSVFDYVVAENGGLIVDTDTGEEMALGPPPDAGFVRLLEQRGVHPLSVGKVVLATWEPHEQTVLEVIKSTGTELQVIFNKGAVMILPSGINKATGLSALLHHLHLSIHNTVAIGDAENDLSLLQAAECAVAVANALPSVKAQADWVTSEPQAAGVAQLIDRLLENDLAEFDSKLTRHYLKLGETEKGPFVISPYQRGILLSGVTGGGKSTFTTVILESLLQQDYQFCLIDPEGDYLQLPDVTVVGNETSVPPPEELYQLLKDPAQSLVINALSVPFTDRPVFFSHLLEVLTRLRAEYGRPHWLILDEAHHLLPPAANRVVDRMPAGFNNFIIISTSPHALHSNVLQKIGTLITIGDNPRYPFEQFGEKLRRTIPGNIPALGEQEICVWRFDTGEAPFKAHYQQPRRLQQRHRKKYATGDMGDNSFVFTGPEGRLHLVANNLMLFTHIAEGVDEETWAWHLHRHDFAAWFRDTIHDGELAGVAESAEVLQDPAASRRQILTFINSKYTG